MEKDIEQLIITDFKQRQLNVGPHAFDRLMDKKVLLSSKRNLTFYKVLAVAAAVLLFIFSLTFRNETPQKPVKNTVTDVNKIPMLPIKNENKTSIPEVAGKVEGYHNRTQHLPKVKIRSFKHPNSNLSAITQVDLSRKPHFKYSDKLVMISDSELNALLATSKAQLINTRDDSLKVNALQMLFELEIEINKPLPEKIILTLKSGTKTVKDILNPKNN